MTILLAVLGMGGWTLGLVAARGRHEWALLGGGKHRRATSEEAPADHDADLAPAEETDGPQLPGADAGQEEEIGEPFDLETMQLPFEDEEGG